MKKRLIAGNWKMYKTPEESIAFLREFSGKVRDYTDREILVCPPFTSLYPASEVLKGKTVKLGAQDVYFHEEGAFTGEISPAMLKNAGVEYVICGHSERRHILGETDGIVNKKVKISAGYGINPVLCIGETREERENGKTFNVLGRQLEKCLEGYTNPEILVIAYEPVWAIGTGLTARPEQAEEVHAFIRELLAKVFGGEVSDGIRILYGGSVKPDNIGLLMSRNNIDGVLVGGASLEVDSFLRIADYK